MDCVHKTLSVVALTALSTCPTLSHAADEQMGSLRETIARHAEPMGIAESGLTGPGGTSLIEDGSAASFFVIGEYHLNTQTPMFTEALVTGLKPAGYSALVLETGKPVTQYVERLIEEGKADEAKLLFADTPFTAAFIDQEEEFRLLEAAVEAGFDLVGIDQVFMGGARFNLARLVDLAPSDEARAIAQDALDTATAGFEKFMTTGDPSGAFLTSTGGEWYDRAEEAFAGSDEAQMILGEMRSSGRIYQLFGMGKNYESNHERIEAMKRRLAERVRSGEPGEKYILKFGGMHSARGYSNLNQQDVGNAASELGVLLGGGSLNVVVAAQKQQRDNGLVDLGSANDAIGVFAEAAQAMDLPDDQPWVVFDLRPLRPLFHRSEPCTGGEQFEAVRQMVWGFDVLVMVDTFTPATPLPGVPTPPGR